MGEDKGSTEESRLVSPYLHVRRKTEHAKGCRRLLRDVSYREIPARKTLVDTFHRNPHHRDTPTGRDCQFCQSFDPAFGKRTPMDKLVYGELNDDATAHMTEDGYVRHRILEIRVRFPATVIRHAQKVT